MISMLYLLEPEVPGEWVPQAIDGTVSGEVDWVFEFDAWLGDELVTSHPDFMISSCLAEFLRVGRCSGVGLKSIRIRVSANFHELNPGRDILVFVKLVPEGRVSVTGETAFNWSGHDVCLSDNGSLVVSQKCLERLVEYGLRHCSIVNLGLTD